MIIRSDTVRAHRLRQRDGRIGQDRAVFGDNSEVAASTSTVGQPDPRLPASLVGQRNTLAFRV